MADAGFRNDPGAGRAGETPGGPAAQAARQDGPACAARQAVILQRLLVPLPGMPARLYFSRMRGVEFAEDGSIRMEGGGRLCGDSYFNAFFPQVWHRQGGLGRIGVTARVEGIARFRAVTGAGRVIGAWQSAGDGEETVFWFDAAALGGQGERVALRIDAPSGARLRDLAYVTDLPPAREIRLSVAVVSHNRERWLEPTLVALREAAMATPGLLQVHVINHGRPFRGERLAALLADPLFRVTEQANLGGSGGFARAMAELRGARLEATHLLLMDDDILLDPRMIDRAVRFAAQARAEVALGGQALEIEARAVLQEAWGQLRRDWLAEGAGAGLDLADPTALSLWRDAPVPHYNGWWFCLLPLSALRRCGLPAPMFLRGDDIEFGLRLAEEGVEMVALPGLAVWHASTRYKHAGMVQYYDLRNLLVNASWHPGVGPMPGGLFVLGWCIHHLLVHRYRAAAASVMAVSDFLAGPGPALDPDAQGRHRRLMRALDHLPLPERVKPAHEETLPRPAPYHPGRSRAMTIGRTVAVLLRILGRRGAGTARAVQIGAPDPLALKGVSYLLALDPAAETCLAMRPHRIWLIGLLLRALWISLRYALLRGRAAALWRGQREALCSAARWAREFALDRS